MGGPERRGGWWRWQGSSGWKDAECAEQRRAFGEPVLLALGFESEGYVPEEAKEQLHAWAKLHKEANDLTNGDMSLMLHKWTTELAHICAKGLAKCILERAAFSAEKQDNIDGVTMEARPPMPHTSCTCSLRTKLGAAAAFRYRDE